MKGKSSERKEAEEALKSGEDRFRTIIEKNADGIMVVDKKGIVHFVNPAAEYLFGHKREELTGELFGFPVVTGETTEIEIIRKNGEPIVTEMKVVETEWEGESSYLLSLRDITERKRAEESLRIKDWAIESSIYGIGIADLMGHLTYANNSFLKMFGYSEEEVLGKHILSFCQKENQVIEAIGELHDEGWAGEIKTIRKDGSLFDISFSASMVKDKDDNPIYIMVSFVDISERKKAEEEMKKLSTSIENATDWVVITDKAGNIEYVNKAVEEISGYKKEELIGKIPRIFKSGKHDEKFYKELWDTILSGRPFPAIFINRKKNKELFYISETVTPLRDEKGNITHFISTGKDITQQKLMEDRLNYLAYYDVLTGLPNRTLFVDRLSQVLARADFHKRFIAVLAIDIDGFKSINDTFGLDVGDNVLKEVGGILSNSIRKGDILARLGGDDFGIVLTDIAQSKDVILVVEKIMNNLSRPLTFDGKEIMVSLSLGISICPDDGKDAHELIKNADLALSKAKQQGRKTYHFYTAGMNERALEFVLLEEHLLNALKNEEFILYYQPCWEINTKKIAGMEALLRWQSKDLGLVSPGKFIPVLEETGMIIEVGEWAFRTACRQVKEWHDRGYPVPVSVNLSLVQFRQRDLTDTLERIIFFESGIDPQLLIVEIIESAFMQDIEFTKSVLKKLKDIGVSISIDDFGTGYSSLSYLKRFPIDNLKIDISFIGEIATDPDTASIVTAIISMARTLGLKTIAEGVETEEQWKILRLLRCDMGQGYYFSPPLPAKDAEKLLI